jgi:hypothetical protein
MHTFIGRNIKKKIIILFLITFLIIYKYKNKKKYAY